MQKREIFIHSAMLEVMIIMVMVAMLALLCYGRERVIGSLLEKRAYFTTGSWGLKEREDSTKI